VLRGRPSSFLELVRQHRSARPRECLLSTGRCQHCPCSGCQGLAPHPVQYPCIRSQWRHCTRPNFRQDPASQNADRGYRWPTPAGGIPSFENRPLNRKGGRCSGNRSLSDVDAPVLFRAGVGAPESRCATRRLTFELAVGAATIIRSVVAVVALLPRILVAVATERAIGTALVGLSCVRTGWVAGLTRSVH
jgi:hypothetical protein